MVFRVKTLVSRCQIKVYDKVCDFERALCNKWTRGAATLILFPCPLSISLPIIQSSSPVPCACKPTSGRLPQPPKEQ